MQVYYPAEWIGGDDAATLTALYEATLEAMVASTITYGQWGIVSDATAVFSMLPYASNDGTGFMSVPWGNMSPGEPCHELR